MGLAKKKPKGLFERSGDLRQDEQYKSKLKELKAISRSFKLMEEEDEITGTASKGAGERHAARLKKALNKGAAQMKAIRKAQLVDDTLIDDYGKFSRRARSLMRAATQTRATKPKGAEKQKTYSKEEISKLPEQGYKAMGGPIGYSQRWKTGREG